MPEVQSGTVPADLELVDTRHVPFRVADDAFIPAERYYDPAFHALESEKLWKHTWQPPFSARRDPGDRRLHRLRNRQPVVPDRARRARFDVRDASGVLPLSRLRM